MAQQEIVPQVDIGGLTLKGLATFNPVLATLSADNVVPMAMFQMENLGSVFHTSGKYAARVPDLLQRCSSVRLDRLALVVGWRKGDAASLMAKSAGGQAVALLSVCLLSLYKPRDVGCILFELCRKVLPGAVAISSVSQLFDVAKLLSAKLDTLGFGNMLAEQVTRIHQAYAHLGHAVPTGFLEDITTDTVVELLHALSRALCEEKLVVRIQGILGMGYILGLVLMMFPEDTLITIAGVVIQEGRQRSIIMEFAISENLQSTIEVESILDHSDHLSIPICLVPRPAGSLAGFHRFNWSGWVADHLHLNFLDVGLDFKQEVLTACCNVLVKLPRFLGTDVREWRRKHCYNYSNPRTTDQYQGEDLNSIDDSEGGCIALLGAYPYERMHRICSLVMRATPTTEPTKGTLKGQFNELVVAVSNATKGFDCVCGEASKCDLSLGWKEGSYSNRAKSKKSCKIQRIWMAVGNSLYYCLLSFFVDAGINSTVYPVFANYSNSVTEAITRLLTTSTTYFSEQLIQNMVFGLIADGSYCREDNLEVAVSSTSTTAYYTALQMLQFPYPTSGPFSVVEGCLIFNGRSSRALRGSGKGSRPSAKKSIPSNKKTITPTSYGECSDLMITIRECLNFLEVRATIRAGSLNVQIDLASVLLGSLTTFIAEPCEHSDLLPLAPKFEIEVMTTSVVAPLAAMKKVAIVQTRKSLTSQLLACSGGHFALLQRDCCLSCTFEQAKSLGIKLIIAG